jgi:NTP pyrophosphatase (non-canonical NTP hydrolase)
MLRDYFPNSNEGSKIYGGFMSDQTLFCKKFPARESINEMLVDVNDFLISNGYDQIDSNEINKDVFSFDRFPIALSPHGYDEEFILFINREPNSNPQSLFLTNELKKFRDARDWEQFHNPKDLAIALNIETSELLELFLWKSSEEANKDKLKEELADVFAYAFLLADKLEFDVEKIVLEKIAKNKEKYPIDKAKGNANKYNEL